MDEATSIEVGERPRSRMKAKELEKFLSEHRGQHHIVILQDFPDPDAMSSAFAHQLIAAQFDIVVDIVFERRISHPQNIALVRLLDLDLIRYNEAFDFSGYDGAVFIDNQGTTTGLLDPLSRANVPTLMIIDHHERQDRLQAEYTDIRRIGATATIYTEYIQEGLLTLDRSHPDHIKCATALMHGLRSETNDLIRAKEDEFLAAAFLSHFYDPALLSEILRQQRSSRVMDVIKKALEKRTVLSNVSVSGIGYLRAEDRDAIPQGADFLLTEENVHTAIVFGIIIDGAREVLSGSMRTLKLTVDPDEFLKETFGKDERGVFFGGGRQHAGGFEIPIGFLSGASEEEFTRLKWQVYDQQVRHKIFSKIGAERSN
ncbi:MAG TPA: bifunctional oligoribonuclease/PAP phosphatase NrnA [Candidatus Tectomicrobia bacterium]